MKVVMMANHQAQLQKPVLKEFLVSGLAASLSHCVCHPLYTLKNRLMYFGHQFRFKTFILQSLRHPKSFLYSGLATRAIGIIPEKAMVMQTGLWIEHYMNRKEGFSCSNAVVAGAFAGAATTVAGCPSERAMVLANVQRQGFVKLIHRTGFHSLYRGWTATLYRDIIFNVTFFTLREVFVRNYKQRNGENPNTMTRFELGYPAGVIAAIAGCPYDVIKTRMQGRPLDAPYLSCFQHFKNIIQKEGSYNLFRGLIPRMIIVPSMMSLFFVINEELQNVFM